MFQIKDGLYEVFGFHGLDVFGHRGCRGICEIWVALVRVKSFNT